MCFGIDTRDLYFSDVNRHSRKSKGQTIMNNLETGVTLATQDSGRRQAKCKRWTTRTSPNIGAEPRYTRGV